MRAGPWHRRETWARDVSGTVRAAVRSLLCLDSRASLTGLQMDTWRRRTARGALYCLARTAHSRYLRAVCSVPKTGL